MLIFLVELPNMLVEATCSKRVIEKWCQISFLSKPQNQFPWSYQMSAQQRNLHLWTCHKTTQKLVNSIQHHYHQTLQPNVFLMPQLNEPTSARKMKCALFQHLMTQNQSNCQSKELKPETQETGECSPFEKNKLCKFWIEIFGIVTCQFIWLLH